MPTALALAAGPAQPHLLDASLSSTPQLQGAIGDWVEPKRRWLRSAGWRHTLLAPGAAGQGDIDGSQLGIAVPGGWRFNSARQAVRAIEQARPDVIEAIDPPSAGRAVLAAAARLDVPAVAWCHHPLPPPRSGPGRALAAAALYADFDLVLAPSRTMVRLLHEHGVQRARYQPLGVDCSVFSASAASAPWRQRLEQQLNLPAQVQLLIYSGRFTRDKNLDVLAQASAMLGRGHCLLAVGEGPCPPRGEHVRVLPPQDATSLARLLANADVFVHAGEQEPFGLTALQAMACGTPLVVSAGGGLGEIADAAGITVAGQRAGTWAEAIAASLANPQSAHCWAALSRARRFDWPLVLEGLVACYRQLMRRHRVVHADTRVGDAAVLAAMTCRNSGQWRFSSSPDPSRMQRIP